jgi:hypothetical protein
VCVPCIVEISAAGQRTLKAFIFATLPAVGDAFAFDEPGGSRCEVVVLAIAACRALQGQSDCMTLLVGRRTASPSDVSADWRPRLPQARPRRYAA